MHDALQQLWRQRSELVRQGGRDGGGGGVRAQGLKAVKRALRGPRDKQAEDTHAGGRPSKRYGLFLYGRFAYISSVCLPSVCHFPASGYARARDGGSVRMHLCVLSHETRSRICGRPAGGVGGNGSHTPIE